MSPKSLGAEVKNAIAARLQAKGIELYDVEFKRERNGSILRIFIDSPGGVDTDTCVLATRAIKDYIDNLPQLEYDFLEVSSPGIDRILRQDQDLARYTGDRVLIKTIQPVEGKKKLIGILTDFTPKVIRVEMEGALVTVPRETISVIRLHPDI